VGIRRICERWDRMGSSSGEVFEKDLGDKRGFGETREG